ncbi:MAG: DUF1569 domain-containing protein [Planctomycetales bacterium]|nr:DUF1569 domain-containing protein [Planctomycetales bacterium]
MSVDTKKAAGRRDVRYQSYDDLLADAQRLAAGPTTTVGNWTLGQILFHLAKSIEASIDGIPFKAPWLMRLVAKLFMKKKFIYKSVPPGFKLPATAAAKYTGDPSVDAQEALAALSAAIDRANGTAQRGDHPAFGKLTREEWDSFNLRHAEMHMSFVKAAGE